MKLKFDIDVRSYELDSYGHVNNAVYLNYFEYTRSKYLEALGFDYYAFFEDGFMLFVTKLSIRYLKPVLLSDKISVEVELVKKGFASVLFHQAVINQNGELCTEAETTLACVSKKTGHPTRFPEKYKLKK